MSLSKRIVSIIAAVTAVAMLALAGLALASSKTLNTAASNKLNEKIAVDSKGRTVYALKGETTKKLLCKSKSCFKLWPPYKVKKGTKLAKASGIRGKLSLLHRNGFYQVVVGGDPLYYYSGDKKKGNVNGNGINGFGGTWHVIGAGPITGGY
jgi:predicted lipoprotein with Yx(FWY)xxD motif